MDVYGDSTVLTTAHVDLFFKFEAHQCRWCRRFTYDGPIEHLQGCPDATDDFQQHLLRRYGWMEGWAVGRFGGTIESQPSDTFLLGLFLGVISRKMNT